MSTFESVNVLVSFDNTPESDPNGEWLQQQFEHVIDTVRTQHDALFAASIVSQEVDVEHGQLFSVHFDDVPAAMTTGIRLVMRNIEGLTVLDDDYEEDEFDYDTAINGESDDPYGLGDSIDPDWRESLDDEPEDEAWRASLDDD